MQQGAEKEESVSPRKEIRFFAKAKKRSNSPRKDGDNYLSFKKGTIIAILDEKEDEYFGRVVMEDDTKTGEQGKNREGWFPKSRVAKLKEGMVLKLRKKLDLGEDVVEPGDSTPMKSPRKISPRSPHFEEQIAPEGDQPPSSPRSPHDDVHEARPGPKRSSWKRLSGTFLPKKPLKSQADGSGLKKSGELHSDGSKKDDDLPSPTSSLNQSPSASPREKEIKEKDEGKREKKQRRKSLSSFMKLNASSVSSGNSQLSASVGSKSEPLRKKKTSTISKKTRKRVPTDSNEKKTSTPALLDVSKEKKGSGILKRKNDLVTDSGPKSAPNLHTIVTQYKKDRQLEGGRKRSNSDIRVVAEASLNPSNPSSNGEKEVDKQSEPVLPPPQQERETEKEKEKTMEEKEKENERERERMAVSARAKSPVHFKDEIDSGPRSAPNLHTMVSQFRRDRDEKRRTQSSAEDLVEKLIREKTGKGKEKEKTKEGKEKEQERDKEKEKEREQEREREKERESESEKEKEKEVEQEKKVRQPSDRDLGKEIEVLLEKEEKRRKERRHRSQDSVSEQEPVKQQAQQQGKGGESASKSAPNLQDAISQARRELEIRRKTTNKRPNSMGEDTTEDTNAAGQGEDSERKEGGGEKEEKDPKEDPEIFRRKRSPRREDPGVDSGPKTVPNLHFMVSQYKAQREAIRKTEKPVEEEPSKDGTEIDSLQMILADIADWEEENRFSEDSEQGSDALGFTPPASPENFLPPKPLKKIALPAVDQDPLALRRIPSGGLAASAADKRSTRKKDKVFSPPPSKRSKSGTITRPKQIITMPPKAQSAADMPFDLKAVKLRPTVVADKDRPTPEDLALQELRRKAEEEAIRRNENLERWNKQHGQKKWGERKEK